MAVLNLNWNPPLRHYVVALSEEEAKSNALTDLDSNRAWCYGNKEYPACGKVFDQETGKEHIRTKDDPNPYE